MILEDRIIAFENLRIKLLSIKDSDLLNSIFLDAQLNNPWFTQDNIRYSLTSLVEMINPFELRKWIKSYNIHPTFKRVGVVLPSNIPLVGFYDFLCVLLSGNVFIGKLSSSNNVLLPFLADLLFSINPLFKELIFFEKELVGIDFLIATGNDYTSSHLEFFFQKTPHIIRKNRSSVAVLDGNESGAEYKKLSHDVFMYFGFGCRNISKIFVPQLFDFSLLEASFQSHLSQINHPLYLDNYNYQKSILTINKNNYLEFSNILLCESSDLSSPISVLHYEYYDSQDSVAEVLNLNQHKIQCVVSSNRFLGNVTQLGCTQKPSLWDYPDGIDVMQFLIDTPSPI